MPVSANTLYFVTVDVFSEHKYQGNQLAIIGVPEDRVPSQEEKQNIAKEFNFSETVFLHGATEKGPGWVVDIFTPAKELPFAGHPTIGTACYLGALHPDLSNGILVTKAGQIPFSLERLPADAQGSVLPEAAATVPQTLHTHQQRIKKDDLLMMQPKLKNKEKQPDSFPVLSITNGMNFALYELDSLDTLGSVRPSPTLGESDIVSLDQGWNPAQLSGYFYVIDQSTSTPEKLVVETRMLDRSLEDPATGSAACCLSGFLALEQKKKNLLQGQSLQVEITQGRQMGRESHISVEVQLDGNGSVDTIVLKGKTVHVMSGYLMD